MMREDSIMYRADKLYNEMMEVDAAIKALKVTDEASLAEYFRLYTELIFNHKWIGSIYDIYADGCEIYREDGKFLYGPHDLLFNIANNLPVAMVAAFLTNVFIVAPTVKMIYNNYLTTARGMRWLNFAERTAMPWMYLINF